MGLEHLLNLCKNCMSTRYDKICFCLMFLMKKCFDGAKENVLKNVFLYRKLEQRAGSPRPGSAGQGEHHPGEDLKYFH